MSKSSRMMEFLWDVIGNNKRWSANITCEGNELIVSILSAKFGKTFRHYDLNTMKHDIKSFLQLV